MSRSEIPLSVVRIVLDSLAMQRILKAAVLCLLLLTIPVQGFAAVTKVFCESMHHSHAASSAEHGRHHDASLKAFSSALSEIRTSSHLPHPHHHCVVCTACCMTVAMMAEVSAPAAPQRGSCLYSLSANTLNGFRPATLDRPPRLFLA